MGRKYNYDCIIIGSGAAGTRAALIAAKSGKKVAIVEKDKWGGTPLNYRDVPYLASLHFSHLYSDAIHGSRFGISSSNLRYNYPTLTHWRAKAIARAGGNNRKIFEDAGITCLCGHAHFVNSHEIAVDDGQVSAANFLITSGTEEDLGGVSGVDSVDYLTPSTALNVTRPPKVVMIVGAGSSGCEIAQYYAELGSKVLLTDLSSRILPREDEEVSQVIEQYFSNRLGIKVLTHSRVVAIERDSLSKKVIFMRDGHEKAVRVESVVIATGVKAATDLGLENAGIKFDKNGIVVDSNLQSSVKHIYAAGDIIGGPSSTEKSIYEANTAIDNMLNKHKNVVSYSCFTRVTDTFPQVATTGYNEDDCIKRDLKYKKVIIPLEEVTAANTSDFRLGFIKILANKKGEILGSTIVCPEAALVSQEISLAIRNKINIIDLASTPHIHNSWSELIRVACRKLLGVN